MPEQLIIEATDDGLELLRLITATGEKLKIKLSEAREIEESLEKVKHEIKELQEVTLPRLLESSGLSMLKLRDGTILEQKNVLYCSVSKERMDEAADYLLKKNMGGILKTAITVDKTQMEAMHAAGIPYTKVHAIHPSTLKAFVKERLELDQDFPQALFGVSQVPIVEIKR